MRREGREGVEKSYFCSLTLVLFQVEQRGREGLEKTVFFCSLILVLLQEKES